MLGMDLHCRWVKYDENRFEGKNEDEGMGDIRL